VHGAPKDEGKQQAEGQGQADGSFHNLRAAQKHSTGIAVTWHVLCAKSLRLKAVAGSACARIELSCCHCSRLVWQATNFSSPAYLIAKMVWQATSINFYSSKTIHQHGN
jgi:hypothetical protein